MSSWTPDDVVCGIIAKERRHRDAVVPFAAELASATGKAFRDSDGAPGSIIHVLPSVRDGGITGIIRIILRIRETRHCKAQTYRTELRFTEKGVELSAMDAVDILYKTWIQVCASRYYEAVMGDEPEPPHDGKEPA